MKNLMLIVICLVTCSVWANEARKTPSPFLTKFYAERFNVQSKAQLESLRNELQALDHLECFEGNRFITQSGTLSAIMDQRPIHDVKQPGLFEMFIWGHHASPSYKSRVPNNTFFQFPTSVWLSLPNGKIQMIFGARDAVKAKLSSEDFQIQFVAEAKKLQSQIPDMQLECVKDEVDVAYARALINLLDHPQCEERLAEAIK